MGKQSKIENLVENYPALGLIRYEWRWRRDRGQRWQQPKMNVKVQMADSNVMHLQANNVDYDGRVYAPNDNDDLRGTRLDYMCAVNGSDRILATLYWEKGEREKMSKDIFNIVDPRKVSYLMWVRVIEWYEPASEQREEETGILFGTEKKGVEVTVYILRRPKDKTFQELIEIADREKREREEAYLYFPKEQPDFPGIHKALKEGNKMHAFMSGGGLRVVSFSGVGYGEHPNIEEALKHLEEDYLAGGRPYEKVYGKLYPHYLTGSTLPTSNLDSWIREGRTFDCWQAGDDVIFQLKGLVNTNIPSERREAVMRTGIPVIWETRGYTYRITRERLPSGDLCTSAKVINSPEGRRDGADPWMYRITKTGRGQNFWDAVKKAFEAEEIEVNK